MGSLTGLLQPGAAAAWLLLPSALVLGVPHRTAWSQDTAGP